MKEISIKRQLILNIFLQKEEMSSSVVYKEIEKSGEEISLVTVKRYLSELLKERLLVRIGAGRSVSYKISPRGRILTEVDVKKYLAIDPDKRYGRSYYNFELFSGLEKDILTQAELKKLEAATAGFRARTRDLSAAISRKELERLVIELAWKSSKIEGNTYTLLDTEKLILDHKVAVDKSRSEARMILNHKDAFAYIRRYAAQFKVLTRKNLEEVHDILVKDLDIDRGLRSKPVGVTGSIYRPLDNKQQISEAIHNLSEAIERMDSFYAKALVALAGIKYIQPFDDGNKRTARLVANAFLIAGSLSPLSYRSVDESDYREATLVFYELNSLAPLKKIFIEQYCFAAQNYAIRREF